MAFPANYGPRPSVTSQTFAAQILDELNQTTTTPVEVTTITPLRTVVRCSQGDEPNMTEFEKFKESMAAELRAVHSKFHSATSSAPKIDRLVTETERTAFTKNITFTSHLLMVFAYGSFIIMYVRERNLLVLKNGNSAVLIFFCVKANRS